MMQIAEQTHEEKVKMYMKCTKKELINMLIQCNTIISSLPPTVTVYPPNQYPLENFCHHDMQWVQDSGGGGFWQCRICGHSTQLTNSWKQKN